MLIDGYYNSELLAELRSDEGRKVIREKEKAFAPSVPCVLEDEAKVFDRLIGIKASMRRRIAQRFADQIRGWLLMDPVIGVSTLTEVNEDDEQEATDRLHVELAKGTSP